MAPSCPARHSKRWRPATPAWPCGACPNPTAGRVARRCGRGRRRLGRAWVEEHHRVATVVDDLVDLYEQAMADSAARCARTGVEAVLRERIASLYPSVRWARRAGDRFDFQRAAVDFPIWAPDSEPEARAPPHPRCRRTSRSSRNGSVTRTQTSIACAPSSTPPTRTSTPSSGPGPSASSSGSRGWSSGCASAAPVDRPSRSGSRRADETSRAWGPCRTRCSRTRCSRTPSGWFLARGTPHLIEGYSASSDVFTAGGAGAHAGVRSGASPAPVSSTGRGGRTCSRSLGGFVDPARRLGDREQGPRTARPAAARHDRPRRSSPCSSSARRSCSSWAVRSTARAGDRRSR